MRRRQRSGGALTSQQWKKLRLQVIEEEPICRLRLDGCTFWSNTADHIIPVSHRPDLRYCRSNLRGACQSCNMHRKNRPLSVVRAEQALARPRQPKKTAAALEFFS